MTERGVDDQLVLPSSPRGPCAEGVCLWALDIKKKPSQLTWVLMKLYASYLIQAFRTPTPMRNPPITPQKPAREGKGRVGDDRDQRDKSSSGILHCCFEVYPPCPP